MLTGTLTLLGFPSFDLVKRERRYTLVCKPEYSVTSINSTNQIQSIHSTSTIHVGDKLADDVGILLQHLLDLFNGKEIIVLPRRSLHWLDRGLMGKLGNTGRTMYGARI